jgi:hypothetical protein
MEPNLKGLLILINLGVSLIVLTVDTERTPVLICVGCAAYFFASAGLAVVAKRKGWIKIADESPKMV